MMTIRSNLLNAIVAEQTDRFVERAVRHLRTATPPFYDEDLQAAIQHVVRGLANAKRHGFTTEAAALRYLEVTTWFGADFGERPDHRLPLAMLSDPAIVADWPSSRGSVLALRGVRM